MRLSSQTKTKNERQKEIKEYLDKRNEELKREEDFLRRGGKSKRKGK